MKILAVMLQDDYGKPENGPSYEFHHFYRTLQEFGECRIFDFGPYLEKPPDDLQLAVMNEAERFGPDLIFFVLYQDQFTVETLDWLKNRFVTVNWFCDDEWRYEGFSKVYAPHFTYVVTTSCAAHEKYQAAGVRSILSQWAASDYDEQMPDDTYSHDVSFVGWKLPFRKWVVDQLAAAGIEVECYGTGWPNGRVTFEKMNAIFRRSKVNLNISNSRQGDLRYVAASHDHLKDFLYSGKVSEQIKGRHFEIAAAGGFQLTNYVEGLEDYFSIGDDIAVYASIDSLADRIRWYLAHDLERRNIARSGHERVGQAHLYKDRFQSIISQVAQNVIHSTVQAAGVH